MTRLEFLKVVAFMPLAVSGVIGIVLQTPAVAAPKIYSHRFTANPDFNPWRNATHWGSFHEHDGVNSEQILLSILQDEKNDAEEEKEGQGR